MNFRGKTGFYGGILANTFILFLLSAWLLTLPWLAGDEKFMIWFTSGIKLSQREIPESEDYALINTSYDLKLIDYNDEFGFPVGNRVITDRGKLAQLLQIAQKGEEKPRYMFFDIFFEDASPDDSLLAAAFQQTDKYIVSYHLDENDQPIAPVIPGVHAGLSDYVVGNIFEGVYKYKLIYNDSLKLTPLRIYEDIVQQETRKKGLAVDMGDWYTFNNFIINYRLLQKDIQNQEAGFNPVNLGELLLLPPEDVQKFLAGKIVLLGDFKEMDMHETLFEITSGPLILLNVLLGLQARDTQFNGWFILVLFMGFYYLSYMAFSSKDTIEMMIRKRFPKIKFLRNLAGFTSYLFLLIILSCITFFLFNVHINIFFLALYLYGLDKIVNQVRYSGQA